MNKDTIISTHGASKIATTPSSKDHCCSTDPAQQDFHQLVIDSSAEGSSSPRRSKRGSRRYARGNDKDNEANPQDAVDSSSRNRQPLTRLGMVRQQTGEDGLLQQLGTSPISMSPQGPSVSPLHVPAFDATLWLEGGQ